MIEVRDVHKRFGDQVVLNGANFSVEDGETVALLGPSGTGKSVLLKHIIGLIKPDSGTIMVDGKDVSHLSRHDLATLRTSIGYVFQNGALFDSMNVFENVRLGITNEEQFRDFEYAKERVAECLRLVNLQPFVSEKFPAELSGGMRKRVRGPSPAGPSTCCTTNPPAGSIRSTPMSSTRWSSGCPTNWVSPA
jgi:phospholipid/cholesterol/gamma-HCH transport system ATP-binding protein